MDSHIVYNSNWKSGLCWGNLAGCLAFYHTLTGLSLFVTNIIFFLISSEYHLLFGLSISMGLVIVLMGFILLPLVFSCVLGRQYHIYATIHGYLTFLINLLTIALITYISYQIIQLNILATLPSKLLLADLGLLILTLFVGLVAWVIYVGRQFHEPNGQFILQL